MNIDLSDDQLNAFEVILGASEEQEVLVLTGPAGSGKTTLVRFIISELESQGRTVLLGAPTGKAALRLTEVTGREAYTMHSLLYGYVGRDEEKAGELVFDDPHAPCMPGEVIVIDEASMVGSKLYTEFQKWVPASSFVIYVGDKEQLEPVKDTWGPDLDEPTALLTQVHRQALESPILAYATAVRQGKGDEWAGEYEEDDDRLQVYEGIHSAREWLLHQRRNSEDATLITFTHSTREHLNAEIRASLGLDENVISVGDRLCLKSNHKKSGLRNGELVTVTSVEPYSIDGKLVELTFEDRRCTVIVNLDLVDTRQGYYEWNNKIWKDAKAGNGDWALCRGAIHVHYGQCLTVHSSQGSQWDNVGFVMDRSYRNLKRRDRAQARRMLYTAATRAVENLVLVMA